MREETVLSLLEDLPDNATHEEAVAWVKRMRRLIDRRDILPGYETVPLIARQKQNLHAQLDEIEHRFRCEIAFREAT